MELFADSANVEEIRELAEVGLIDGVTTNPSLLAGTSGRLEDRVVEICSLVTGSVSVEVIETTAAGMVESGRKLAGLAPNVTVKVPITLDGLRACRQLSDEGTSVNTTLVFSTNQAVLAAKARSAFVSPFVGRLDDLGANGIGLVEQIRKIFDRYRFSCKILAASVRSPQHIAECMRIGADVATAPPSVIRSLANHPLTQAGLEKFLADWHHGKGGERNA